MQSRTTEYDDEPLTQLTLSDLLRNRAERIGDQLAVAYGPAGTEYTFSELNATANSVANSLLSLGVEIQDNVSVMAHNPLNSVLSLAGINKGGMVYSPINFEYKGDALAYQLNDTDPELLIIEDRYLDRLNAIVDDLARLPEIVVIKTDQPSDSLDDRLTQSTFEALQDGSTDEPSIDVTWYDEASIVYTSGTTGMPKGVVIPYRWIFANYTLFRQQLLNSEDVVHTSLPMYHVGGVYFDIHAGWAAGAPTILWDRFSPNDFWNRIDKYGATTVTLVSVMATWLEKHSEREGPNTLNKVHMQPLPEQYEQIAHDFGFDFVTVGFGQTESGLPVAGALHAATSEYATPDDIKKGKPPDEIIDDVESIGAPVVDAAPADRYMGQPISSIVEIETLDEHDEPTEVGTPGELAIRPKLSEIMLKEYYGKPDRTVEAFSNLWFHTGDSAYADEDGNYFYVDRQGDVIRRRGENISSLQVQESVNTHEMVEGTAAYPVPAREGGEDEVAITVEVAEGATLTEDELRDYLVNRMPEFMVPKYIDFVDEIPTTKTNKMEKYKLRQDVIEREDL